MTKEILAQANELNARIASLKSYMENINNVLKNAESLTEATAHFDLDAMFEIDNGSLNIWSGYTVSVLRFLLHAVNDDVTRLQQEFNNL